MARRFGPVEGAGVVLEERAGAKRIAPSVLGTSVMVGILEKGPVGELIFAGTSKGLLKRRTGSYIDDSLVPDAAIDFFDLGRRAGELYLVRITDGTEVKAQVTLRDRKNPSNEVIKIEANNGGRWGGKEKVIMGDVGTIATDITETTLTTGITMLEDEWIGGRVALQGVPNKTYEIVGNTAAGVVTVSADSEMYSDLTGGADPTNKAFILTRWNEGKAISVIVKDGARKPTTEWGLEVYLDGEIALNYADLSSSPAEDNYFVRVINDDADNDQIVVEDLWTGEVVADTRPQNAGGEIEATQLAATTITATIFKAWNVGTGDGAVGSPTPGTEAQPDLLELTCTDDSTPGSEVFSVKSSLAPLDDLPDATVGVAYTAKNKYGFGFTITAGSTNYVVGDKIYISVFPLPVDGYKGDWLVPDASLQNIKLRIESNTVNTVSVKATIDLNDYTSVGKFWRIEGGTELRGGHDGIAGVGDAQYINAYDIDTSPIKSLFGKNKGLVKIANPGVTSAAVQIAGQAFADEHNYQYRIEIPSNILTEDGAEDFCVNQVGRSEFSVVSFPSFMYVTDPVKKQGLKLVSATGAIFGRESLVAQTWGGYQKAGTGVDVTIPSAIKLPTGETVLNEEFLNPRGIGVLKFRRGDVIIWGDRTLAATPEWKWKHQREQMSNYEHVLQENFDWIIYSINDPATQDEAITALTDYFLPEWAVKRALRGEKFEDACAIKIDEEINTDATRAEGDMYAEITLRLADTVERFIITIGKAGIVEEALAA